MSKLHSWLPDGGGNLFQEIKKVSAEAEKNGKKLIKLSIGQPSGAAFEMARKAAAEAVMSGSESMHEYQDNGSPGCPEFSKKFVQAHCVTDLAGKNLGYLPTPGTKPMLWAVPQSCGSPNDSGVLVYTATKPGYPTPAVACGQLMIATRPLKMNPENGFLFRTEDLEREVGDCVTVPVLIMMNYPHNPSGQVMNREWLMNLCEWCEKKGNPAFQRRGIYRSQPYERRRHSYRRGVNVPGSFVGRSVFRLQSREFHRLANRGDSGLSGFCRRYSQNQRRHGQRVQRRSGCRRTPSFRF